MNGFGSDFAFYLTNGLIVVVGAAAMAFEFWFMGLYYIYANMVVLPICAGLGSLGLSAFSKMRTKYRTSL